MAYDASPDTPLNSGNNIRMSIEIDDRSKAKDVFEALSKNGTVHDELREREWNAILVVVPISSIFNGWSIVR